MHNYKQYKGNNSALKKITTICRHLQISKKNILMHLEMPILNCNIWKTKEHISRLWNSVALDVYMFVIIFALFEWTKVPEHAQLSHLNQPKYMQNQ